jgi:hypothetical protein
LAVDLTLHALDLGAWDIGIAAIDTTDAGALVDVQAATEALGMQHAAFTGHLFPDQLTAMRAAHHGEVADLSP